MNKECAVDKAVNIFTAYSQSFNCVGKSYTKSKTSFKYKEEPKRNLRNAIERLSKSGIHVFNKEAYEIIEKFKDREDVQFYLDWPYIGSYRCTKKLYQTEMTEMYRHMECAELLKDAKAAVVFSDYRCPHEGVPTVYDVILGDDWHCYQIGEAYNTCKVIKEGGKREKVCEFIWTNRVPDNAKYYVSMKDYKEKLTMEEYWERVRNAGELLKIPSVDMKEYRSAYGTLYPAQELFTKEQIKAKRELEKKERKEAKERAKDEKNG